MTKFDPASTKVAVLMGGWSAEREVSLVSGAASAKALREAGYAVTEVDAQPNLAETLTKEKPDVVFNALHGRWGEDGCVQGLFEMLRIPYTHSGVLASSLAMDKQRSKLVFAQNGIPCAESKIVSREAASRDHQMEPPYVVKPNNEGSSVGVFIVRPGDNRPPGALGSKEWNLGDEVMVEKYLPGRELTVAVMGYRPLAVTEILTKAEFYDYGAKYDEGGSTHQFPADLQDSVTEMLMDYALKAHVGMGCRGVTRSDFRLDDKTGACAILEINTQPGMTPTSLVPEQAGYVGMDFKDLVVWILEDASCDR